MQAAGEYLERSTALGALMQNEERRLVESVRRCDVWATCASLVLGVQAELIGATGGSIEFDDWHMATKTIFGLSSSLSLMCMGWVAYDVLRAAEEAQALAHASASSNSCAWINTTITRRVHGGAAIYPPLETMRDAVAYLNMCLRELRTVFSFGLCMASVSSIV